uniref:Secreted protein n=1 Tax=Anguilla anguilla TaxID=7936 RepID=A0A0E9W840_ANGAN
MFVVPLQMLCLSLQYAYLHCEGRRCTYLSKPIHFDKPCFYHLGFYHTVSLLACYNQQKVEHYWN